MFIGSYESFEFNGRSLAVSRLPMAAFFAQKGSRWLVFESNGLFLSVFGVHWALFESVGNVLRVRWECFECSRWTQRTFSELMSLLVGLFESSVWSLGVQWELFELARHSFGLSLDAFGVHRALNGLLPKIGLKNRLKKLMVLGSYIFEKRGLF